MGPRTVPAVGAVIAAAAWIVLSHPAGSPGFEFVPKLDKAREDRGRLVSDHCRATGDQTDPLVCSYGARESKRKVVLFGDSHALQWGPALIPLAEKRGWKLITLLRANCPIANVKAEARCATWRNSAMRRIREIRPHNVIVSTSIGNRYRIRNGRLRLSRRASESRLRSGMVRTIRRLQAIPGLSPGNGLRLIRDQVTAPFVPADCLRENGGSKARCSFRNHRKFAPGFDWVAAKRTGITPTIDPTKALCGPKWCSPVEGRILKYRDNDHVTASYARGLSDWFGRRLGIP